MTEKFNGFSQEEINKIYGQTNKNSGAKSKGTVVKQAMIGNMQKSVGIRRAPDKWSKNPKMSQNNATDHTAPKQQPQQPASKSGTSKEEKSENGAVLIDSDTTSDTNLDGSISTSLEEALFYRPLKKSENIGETREKPTKHVAFSESSDSCSVVGKTDKNGNDSSILQIDSERSGDRNFGSDLSLVRKDNLPVIRPAHEEERLKMVPLDLPNANGAFRGISLKDFESHRKMIEEQNKQKKEILYKAIEQHTLKTAAEARKIEGIKADLTKLDNDLAVDVAILRKQIDLACIHFSNMEKQYMKIEAQFLKAKLDLHNAAEKKELLTEHLCTVIAHNEDRKAQKLTELMEKVGLSPTGEIERPETELQPPCYGLPNAAQLPK